MFLYIDVYVIDFSFTYLIWTGKVLNPVSVTTDIKQSNYHKSLSSEARQSSKYLKTTVEGLQVSKENLGISEIKNFRRRSPKMQNLLYFIEKKRVFSLPSFAFYIE